MSRNDIMEDLQAYMDHIERQLHASRERELIAQKRVAELETALDNAIVAMLSKDKS